ncbi:hypothetical protein MMC25_001448 [Agyrium rufum]|nr:hypothetical protein [Agyrium rufum]
MSDDDLKLDHAKLVDLILPMSGKVWAENNHQVKAIIEKYDTKKWRAYEGRHAILRLAALRGRTEIVRLLLDPERGPEVNKKDKSSNVSALHEAAYNSHPDIVELLLSHGADCKNITNDGLTPLHRALQRMKWASKEQDIRDTVQMLLKHGADLKWKTFQSSRTPVHYAAMNCHESSMPVLLKYPTKDSDGTRYSERDIWGNLPLHLAAYMGFHNIVRMLLEDTDGADINDTNKAGETPLYRAFNNYDEVESTTSDWAQHEETVKVLLKWNADIRTVVHGLSVLDRAESSQSNSEVARLIIRKARELQYGLRRSPADEVPVRLKAPISIHAQRACQSLQAGITLFFDPFDSPGSFKQRQTARRSVSDILYNDGAEGLNATLNVLNHGRSPHFLWYHLPANNLEWIKHLHARLHEGNLGSAAEVTPESFSHELNGLQESTYYGCDLQPQIRRRTVFGKSKDVDFTFISIPYFSCENYSDQLAYAQLPHSIGNTENLFDIPKGMKEGEADLVFGYQDVHRRQTLDQYYHPHMHSKTVARDSSQVMLRAVRGQVVTQTNDGWVLSESGDRYRSQWWPPDVNLQARDFTSLQEARSYKTSDKESTMPDTMRIIMVNHLWMWLVGPDTVITCSPQSLHLDQERPLSHIFTELNDTTQPPISSTRDLAVLILKHFSTAYTIQDIGATSIFNSFNLMIDETADLEIEHFKRFIENARLADRAHDHTETKPDQAILAKALHNLGVIEPEIKNLCEVKDILDELKIIDSVFVEQEKVIGDFRKLQLSSSSSSANQRVDTSAAIQHRQYQESLNTALQSGRDEVAKMRRNAERTQEDILRLLDLKQKQATMIESRSSRQQAEDTAKQGDTVLVFTIVTIVFLPASFMAAFFAVPNINIPGVQWGIGYVVGIIILVTVAISGPLVAVAFNIDAVRRYFEAEAAGGRLLKAQPGSNHRSELATEAHEKHRDGGVRRRSVLSRASQGRSSSPSGTMA